MRRVELALLFSFSFVVFCLLFLFACVVLPHYVVNKDEYKMIYEIIDDYKIQNL